jgi:clan AA aspartic protease (TIGR02281 family)
VTGPNPRAVASFTRGPETRAGIGVAGNRHSVQPVIDKGLTRCLGPKPHPKMSASAARSPPQGARSAVNSEPMILFGIITMASRCFYVSNKMRGCMRIIRAALAAMFQTLVVSAVLAAPATAEVRVERTFPAGSASTSTKTEAPALVLGGTFVILATVNGAVQAALRVDSGATDVMLPRAVAARLISAGSLTHADYVTTKTYRLADGSLRTQKVYRLRSLKVGTLIVRDIPCTISNDDTGLLGQSFLSKAQDWAMDNRRHVLTLTY